MTVFRLAAIMAGALVAQSFVALPQAHAQSTMAGDRNTDVSAQNSTQAQRRVYRARPRVHVYPYQQQPPFWEYPRPGVYSWPGPNGKRDCRAWYVVENRPSGAVMTPRMQCWWVPG
jgi:hypothetical protein